MRILAMVRHSKSGVCLAHAHSDAPQAACIARNDTEDIDSDSSLFEQEQCHAWTLELGLELESASRS